jgi:hypothetical protein
MYWTVKTFTTRFHSLPLSQGPLYIPYIMEFACKCKGKTILLQVWTGPEGFRRLRFPDFKTFDT